MGSRGGLIVSLEARMMRVISEEEASEKCNIMNVWICEAFG